MGVGQIILLQNIGSSPAWYYPDGSALGRDWITFVLPDVCFEDIIFVPACYSIFYLFMYLIRNVTDFARPYLVHAGVAFVGGIAYVGYTGGPIAHDMIIYLIVVPILIYLLIKDWLPNRFEPQNVTHALLAFAFIILFTAPWEFWNAYIQFWVYDVECDLYGSMGWFFSKKLHVGIFFMYAWTGFIMCYFAWVVYTPKVKV